MTNKRLERLEEVGVPEPAGASSAGAEVSQQRLLTHITHVGDLRPPKRARLLGKPTDSLQKRVWRSGALRWGDFHSFITQSPR